MNNQNDYTQISMPNMTSVSPSCASETDISFSKCLLNVFISALLFRKIPYFKDSLSVFYVYIFLILYIPVVEVLTFFFILYIESTGNITLKIYVVSTTIFPVSYFLFLIFLTAKIFSVVIRCYVGHDDIFYWSILVLCPTLIYPFILTPLCFYVAKYNSMFGMIIFGFILCYDAIFCIANYNDFCKTKNIDGKSFCQKFLFEFFSVIMMFLHALPIGFILTK